MHKFPGVLRYGRLALYWRDWSRPENAVSWTEALRLGRSEAPKENHLDRASPPLRRFPAANFHEGAFSVPESAVPDLIRRGPTAEADRVI